MKVNLKTLRPDSKRRFSAILAPLEEAVAKNKPASQHHHVDNERERTYSLAGSVDAQIKLLAQDLKEVSFKSPNSVEFSNSKSASYHRIDWRVDISR